MFCSNCGTEVMEGAVFCPKCGVKLIQESATTATASTEPKAVSGNNQADFYNNEAFRNLGEESDKNYGSTIKPYYCRQFSRIESGRKANFNWAAFFWGGLNMLYNGCNKLFLMTYLPLSIVAVVASALYIFGVTAPIISIVIIIITDIGNLILSIINGFNFNKWYYKDVSRNPEKQRDKKGLWIWLAFLVIENIIATISMNSPANTPTYENTYNDYYSIESSTENLPYKQTEDIALSKTYINEEEGFSFMYPDDWELVDEENLIVEVACTSYLGTYAAFGVEKVADDGSLFTLTRADFEAEYSSMEEYDNVEVIDWSDITLDGCPGKKLTWEADIINGVRAVFIDYYYIQSSYAYIVECDVVKSYYDTYMPKLDAIMDSYTITKTAGSYSNILNGEDVADESIMYSLMDWFQRHPFMNNLKIQYTKQVRETEEGRTYYLFEMYMGQELYGILGVDSDTGDIVMDSYGDWTSLEMDMEQWYLGYYWGWTDDSGYYSDFLGNDLYGIYDEAGNAILEYHVWDDLYVICNYDGSCYIEYDDGSEASEISIADFAGTYVYDASFEIEGHWTDFYYSLEIGAWNGYNFSVFETWRGIEILGDEYARPVSLAVDTLTFEVFNPDVGYEIHSMTYVPAENSPLGRDVIYIDGEDAMPFVRE